MMKTAIALGALVLLAGCSKPAPNSAQKQLFAYYDAQLNQIERETTERMNEPWPTVKPAALERAKRRGQAMVNCLNPRWAGENSACGEDPVFCADVHTQQPAAGYVFSPKERRCVKDGLAKVSEMSKTDRELFCPPFGTATNCTPKP